MDIEEAKKELERILQTKKVIDRIEDEEEIEIEYNAYFEEMPFEAIETLLKELESADHLASVEYIKANFIDKDKIKAEIEELDKEYKKISRITKKAKEDKESKEYIQDMRYRFATTYTQKIALQELLDESEKYIL